MTDVGDSTRQRIGPYVVVGVVARGATSEIVKAIDTDQKQTVAIKILSRDLVENPDARARFEQESLALTELKHPNIARIYATGLTSDGRPFFVMEFVEGRSLMDLILDKVEMSVAQQLDLIIQAAEGFRAALNRNIIHRDVKPANLMVESLGGTETKSERSEGGSERLEARKSEELGRVAGAPSSLSSPTSNLPPPASNLPPSTSVSLRLKVVDFGLAKIIREDAHSSSAGILMGTPRYMAPEVAAGRPADHRSDIYSLGATFYHLLAGRPPYDGETPSAVMEQHISGAWTPPYLFNPEIPADVCEIVERAMAKEPSHRYQDYDEMLSDLKAAKMALLVKGRGDSREPAFGEQATGAGKANSNEALTPAAPDGWAFSTMRRAGWRLAIVLIFLVAGLAGAIYLVRSKSAGESSRLLPVLVRTLLQKLGK